MTRQELKKIEDSIYSMQPKRLKKSLLGNLKARAQHDKNRREWVIKYREAVKNTDLQTD